MMIEINIFLCDQLISMIIMGYPGGKINMAVVSAKRSVIPNSLHACASSNKADKEHGK